MKVKAICYLILLGIIGSVAASQPSAAKTGPRPDCGPIKKPVTDWTQFRFDLSRTGSNPYEALLSPATVPTLVLSWKYTTGNFTESSPAVVNGVVYVGSGDYNVYALNASN